MKHSLPRILLAMALIVGFTLFIPSFTYANTTSICDLEHIPDDMKAASGCNGGTSTLATAENVAVNIANIAISVIAIVAVIFVIKGGVDYMTSLGDSGKLKRAKDTILYAVIGLIVCALSFAIVNFVVFKINDNNTAVEVQEYNPPNIQSKEACKEAETLFKENAKSMNKEIQIVQSSYENGDCKIEYKEV